jgi:hypothetical protein
MREAMGDESGDVLAVVECVAGALDADDFGSVEQRLHPDVVYTIDNTIHEGSEAVTASYRRGSEMARRLFDHVDFDHAVVGLVDGRTARVDFEDRLESGGEVLVHHSVQDIEVDPAGLVIRITDRPVAGEAGRGDAFMARHGLERS